MLWRRSLLLAPLTPPVELPDIRSIAPDLVTPPMEEGTPAPGRRVRMQLDGYRGSGVYHALYLPRDYRPGRKHPVIVEYAGNGNYRNRYGDVSEGVPEGSNLGYGMSGGNGFLWLCVPYVDAAERQVRKIWWGDVPATLQYCRDAVNSVVRDHGGDPRRVVLCGFSRGSIGCNYLGLHDDRIAQLWRAFVCYSHYDGVRQWPYEGSDRDSALVRLRRLGGRRQFICHEVSVEQTRQYLRSTGIAGKWTFRTVPFRNHNDQWMHRDTPLRRELREWLAAVV
jgi:hypothetical protein